MKIQITKTHIIITPAPKRNKKDGLRVWFWRKENPKDNTLPIATADLIRGKEVYPIPKEFRYAIKGIEF